MLVSGGTMALQEEPLFDSFENGFFPSPKQQKDPNASNGTRTRA